MQKSKLPIQVAAGLIVASVGFATVPQRILQTIDSTGTTLTPKTWEYLTCLLLTITLVVLIMQVITWISVANAKTIDSAIVGKVVFSNRNDLAYQALLNDHINDATCIDVVGISNDRFSRDLSISALRAFSSKHGARLRIAFLNPDGSAIVARSALESYKDGFLAERTTHNLVILEKMVSELSADEASAIQIRKYDFSPVNAITIFDSKAVFIHSYPPKLRGADTPAFYFTGDEFHAIIGDYCAEFTKIWNKADGDLG